MLRHQSLMLDIAGLSLNFETLEGNEKDLITN